MVSARFVEGIVLDTVVVVRSPHPMALSSSTTQKKAAVDFFMIG